MPDSTSRSFGGAHRRPGLLILAAATALLPGVLGAQMPGVPTLQNAWANPGLTAAVNAGTGGGSQTVALAAAWAPRSGRFQVSGGAGYRDAELGGSGGAYGVRAAFPIRSFAGGSLGFAGFLGIGGAQEPERVVLSEEGGTLTQVPLGVGIGYRRAFSFIRGASVYATPFYSYNRLTVGDSTSSKSLFRVSVGVDIGITNRIGVTGGAEFGASAGAAEPGPTGAVYGLGASWAFGRR